MEFEAYEAWPMTLLIDTRPEGVRGGQRGPEGVGELAIMSPGAGMVQMGPQWVRLGGV